MGVSVAVVENLATIIGDESHTVETWTGDRFFFSAFFFGGLFFYYQRARFSCSRIVFKSSPHFSSAMFLTSAFVYWCCGILATTRPEMFR